MQRRTPSRCEHTRHAPFALSPTSFGIAAVAALVLFAIAAPAASALEEGDRAPAFSLPALDGRGEVSLDQYKGKVIWLDFWASWCPPCLTSLPELEAMRKQMPASQFQVVAINIDEKPNKALRFLEKQPVGYPSASDPDGALPEVFGLETMPTSYLIDQKGVIRLVHKGYRAGDIDKIKAEATKLMRKPK
jgi:peroxiredoxin